MSTVPQGRAMRASSIPWGKEQRIPNTELVYLRDGGRKGSGRLIWVRCVKHGNAFQVWLGNVKRGDTTGCRKNKPCILYGFEKAKIIAGTTLIYLRTAGSDKYGQLCVRVRCKEHGNEFRSALADIKNENTTGCRSNQACILHGLKRGETVAGTTLIYLRTAGRDKRGRQIVRVRCLEHGNEFETQLYSLKSGVTTGCQRNRPCIFHGFEIGKIISGTTLVCLDLLDPKTGSDRMVRVRCREHGNEFEVLLQSLKTGHTKSCRQNDVCVLHAFRVGQIIPNTDLEYVGPSGRGTRARRMAWVRCSKHRNKFEVSLSDLKSGNTASCKHNESCVIHGLKKGKKIGDSNFIFVGRNSKIGGIKDTYVYCLCDPSKTFLHNLSSIKTGRIMSCGCLNKWQSENGEWGSQPEVLVMNWLSDIGIPYVHDKPYNHGTQHRWDISPLQKTAEGKRFLVEVTDCDNDGPKRKDPKYWPSLRAKISRARRLGDIVVVLKFFGKNRMQREDVCDSVLFPALVKHGIIN